MMVRSPSSLVSRLAACGPVGAALVFGAADALAQSCAMCTSSFGENDPVSRAFSWSILFLMAAPYTIVGGVALFLFYMHRRTPGRRRAAVIDLGRAGRLTRRSAPEDSGGEIA